MILLILLVVVGLGMAYFATQNGVAVPLTLADYVLGEYPLYVVVLVSILLGLFLGWLVNIVNGLSSTLTIHGKDSQLKKLQQENKRLEEEVIRLENLTTTQADEVVTP